MTDIENRAKRIVYSLARAVEAWRDKHGGRDPVIVIPGAMLAHISLGGPGVIGVNKERGTLLGCYMEVSRSERVYLAEEVEINAKQNGSA